MEERWFYEAVIDTYLPLLDMCERLVHDDVRFRFTLSFSPTLLAMLNDSLMQERTLQHLDKLIRLSEKEQRRLRRDPEFLPLAAMYYKRFRHLRELFLQIDGDLIGAFKSLQQEGQLEIMISSATHAYLPLIKTEEAIRAQIEAALSDYEYYFEQKPSGMWLPECGYTQGIDRILNSSGIDYFISDASAITHATPRPNRHTCAPLMTPYGVSAFARDPLSSEQVWSKENGYPGDYNYREYYRDIGWDLGWDNALAWEYIKPYVLPDGERVHTGIKYHRITGTGKERAPYNPDRAEEKAREHAADFVFNRKLQLQHWNSQLDRIPVITAPYDAELFGHWWYEGILFLEWVCRLTGQHDEQSILMSTPSEYLQAYPVADTGQLNPSSWGRNQSSEVWLQGNNDWIYRHLHKAEERMIELATRFQDPDRSCEQREQKSLLVRSLNQAARELMLAESSDWAFIMDAGTVVPYAIHRFKEHMRNFHKLCRQIESSCIEADDLLQLEEKDALLPALDYRIYACDQNISPYPLMMSGEERYAIIEATQSRRNLFMLAWEYPPKQVGGLARAVCDLSETIAGNGEIVHVITTSDERAPLFEQKNGVYIHRVLTHSSGDTDFFHWIFEMNLAMTRYLISWHQDGGRIDILHAHDWMVYYTAREIKHSLRIPMMATIHATEWGRNRGELSSDLSRQIHHLEWNLTYEASAVIVCSDYMKREVLSLFQLPYQKVSVIPNGIQRDGSVRTESKLNTQNRTDHLPVLEGSDEKQTIFYIGRLVFEKGIHILIHALKRVVEQFPRCELIIAGSGPMEDELRQEANKLQLQQHVHFSGFVNDLDKAAIYRNADVCVFPSLYEPFGIVALEAMASQTPVVVSDTGGLAELVNHGEDGYKALPGHVDSLAWHISELLYHPDTGRRMALRAYEKIKQFYNWDRIAAATLSLYDAYKASSEEPVLQQ